MDLKTARRLKNFSQLQLATEVGVHHSRVSLIERGYQKPTRDQIDRIEVALEMKNLIEWSRK